MLNNLLAVLNKQFMQYIVSDDMITLKPINVDVNF